MSCLSDLNQSSCRHLTLDVRVLHGRIVPYSYQGRKGEQVNATKFCCTLVGSDSRVYCDGLVQHDFKNPMAVQKASEKFRDGTAWRISSMGIVQNAVAYSSCSHRVVVSLQHPAQAGGQCCVVTGCVCFVVAVSVIVCLFVAGPAHHGGQQ
jgi:hypothetical protein